jgi:GNAT superfamily N-acetyltransferase
MSIVIRRAGEGDEAAIHGLLRGLAEFENLTDRFLLTPEIVRRDMLGPHPVLTAALAFDGAEPVGVATWYWTYSSFRAVRGLFIEDIYVQPARRGSGLGKAFFAFLAAEAKREGAMRLDWVVLDWNEKAQNFYRSLGGKPVAEWLTYRLEGEAMDKLAQ